MTDRNRVLDPEAPGDDTYVLEDTGESLEDFDAEGEVEVDVDAAAGEQAFAPAPAAGALGELQVENQKLKDQYLRRLADFENYRKRVEREKADHLKYALSDIVRELVPVFDNFERALASSAGEGASEFRTGVEMIYKQFADALQRSGVRAIGESNVPFDPTIHEAVMREENATVPSQTVVQVLQNGYFLNDRLIRPAMVKVAVGGSEQSGSEES